MPRQKKSRKPGPIGVRKDPDFAGRQKQQTKKKPQKGNPSGSRQNVDTAKKRGQSSPKNTDPRHGSKKLVPLVTQQQKKSYATPAEELAAIEADARLTALLDKAEKGEKLRIDQQQYVDEKLARHGVLCDLLGISREEEKTIDDPYDSLDAISLSDFDDSEDD
jgi:ribosome assembly protein YihI (activator of Der GTPase)